MAGDLFGENQDDALQFNWKDSSYRFTEPVRYFKSNDPYYWEVDNIPVKQLEENILWLKDQLASFEVSGINREHFSELKPYAGGGRVVKIKKGKFIGRVNDAYQKGITTIQKTVFESLENGDRKFQFGISGTVLKAIAGDILNFPLYNNGLFEHLQHHDVGRFGAPSLAFRNLLPEDNVINSLPKNRLAKWRQGFTSTNVLERLNQQAVEFTRRWGGVIRTSLVNITEDLEIDVPPFSAEDFSNHTDTSPAVRFDLLFIYTHPVDSPSTAIVKPDGEGPTIITKPRLGLVKGAGVVNLLGRGPYDDYNSKDDANFFDSAEFSQALADNTAYFDQESGLDSSSNKYQIMSTMSDQLQQNTSLKGFYGNFPSPDDLMNLTPLLQEDIENNNLALLGQSVLPIAYIVVKKGSTQITNNDIVDIRPFFRTAELSYNERAGIAAAFPPLSLANPAVGKTEMLEAITKAVTYVKDYVDGSVAPPTVDEDNNDDGQPIPTTIGYPVAQGSILGGLKYGVEGGLIHEEIKVNGAIASSDNAILDILVNKYGYAGLNGVEYLPLHAGWEVASWCNDAATTGEAKGSLRNDRIFNCIGDTSNLLGDSGNALVDAYLDLITDGGVVGGANGVDGVITANAWNSVRMQTGLSRINFVKKKLQISLPPGFVDYSVKAQLLNCSVLQAPTKAYHQLLMNWEAGVNQNGSVWHDMVNYSNSNIFIEKGPIKDGKANFTIFVFLPSFGPAARYKNATQSLPFLCPGATSDDRNSSYGSFVSVLTEARANRLDSHNNQNFTYDFGGPTSQDGSWSIFDKTYFDVDRVIKGPFLPPTVTYPSVQFEITGYTGTGTLIYEAATQVFN